METKAQKLFVLFCVIALFVVFLLKRGCNQYFVVKELRRFLMTKQKQKKKTGLSLMVIIKIIFIVGVFIAMISPMVLPYITVDSVEVIHSPPIHPPKH